MKTYGALALTESSPSQQIVEPLTLAQAREFLRCPNEPQEDALIEGFISGAREIAEGFYGRDLAVKQWDLTLDCFPAEIELREPLRSVDLVQYKDSDGNETALVEDTDYIVDRPRALVLPAYGRSWPSFTPWPSSSVLIRFTNGYSETSPFWNDAGKRILVGMQLAVSDWYYKRLPEKEIPDAVKWLFSFGAKRAVR